jgi:ubiquinone/menaquinone biosynthesis C-methylase UbiE
MQDNDAQAFADYEESGWQKAASGYQGFNTLTSLSIPYILRRLSKEKVSILDIACGWGDLSYELADEGHKITAVDNSQEMIEIAKEKHTHENIDYQVGNAESLKFNDNNFDYVFSNHGLIHFARPEVVLKELYRVTKPEGGISMTLWDEPERRIAFSLVNQAIAKHGDAQLDAPMGLGMEYFTDQENLKNLFENAGWKEIKTEHLPIIWHLDSPEKLVEYLLTGTVLMAGKLKIQSPEALKKIKSEVVDLLKPYTNSDGTVDVPQGVLLVEAGK